jgi:hypothetical protein
MMRWIATLAAVVLWCGIAGAAEFYVAPDGGPQGDGSKAKPWDLKTAFSAPAAVKPGDTIWLRGGVYKGATAPVSNLTGTAEKPIIVRQAIGERATLDMSGGGALIVEGAYTWYWGFEMAGCIPDAANPDKTPARGGGIYCGNTNDNPGLKFINLVVHDTSGVVFGFWKGALEGEIYGCLIYYGGYDGKDRGYAHAIYAQNVAKTGRKYLTDNVIFGQYSHGIHVYTEKGNIDDFTIEGNISFDNGLISSVSGATRNILVGGKSPAENPIVVNNLTYFSPRAKGGGSCDLGFGRKGTLDAVVKDNYFVHTNGDAFRFRTYGGKPEITGNTFCGGIQAEGEWIEATQTKPNITAEFPKMFPNNTYMGATRPTGTRVAVRPNKYEPGRANICVFNWDNKDAVDVDLSNVLKAGDKYEVRDAQNYFGPAVARSIYDEKPVALPMNLTATAPVLGKPSKPFEHTPREFNAFIVIRTIEAEPARK